MGASGPRSMSEAGPPRTTREPYGEDQDIAFCRHLRAPEDQCLYAEVHPRDHFLEERFGNKLRFIVMLTDDVHRSPK